MDSCGSALPNNSHGTSTQTPAQIITPPPAYGDGTRPLNMSSSPTGHLAPDTHSYSYYSDDEDEALKQNLSAINIIIKCPLSVKGDGNLVAIDTASSANKIAQGIVGALKGMSIGGDGVPMIDRDGQPRPITVTAMADVEINGSKNVVGDKVRPMLPQPAPRPASDNKKGTEVIKREQNGSEEAEPDSKRSRVQ